MFKRFRTTESPCWPCLDAFQQRGEPGDCSMEIPLTQLLFAEIALVQVIRMRECVPGLRPLGSQSLSKALLQQRQFTMETKVSQKSTDIFRHIHCALS